MYPVTGPFTSFQETFLFSKQQTWYRQKKPYDMPLPFNRVEGWSYGPGNFGQGSIYGSMARGQCRSASLYAKAYSWMLQDLGETASLGVTLAQYREADRMISGRASQLSRFTKSVVKRDAKGIASSLGIAEKQVKKVLGTRWGRLGKLSDLWLEFWFGWSPMISDINTAVKVLGKEPPFKRITGRSKRFISVNSDPFPPMGRRQFYTGYERCSVSVDVRVQNPNTRLAAELGLLNPAIVLYDVIPWSFLLGWISNIDAYLSSWSDFLGLETTNGSTTWTTTISGRDDFPSTPSSSGTFYAKVKLREVFSTPPRPQFALKDLKFSPTRGATAISLLGQQLRRLGN